MPIELSNYSKTDKYLSTMIFLGSKQDNMLGARKQNNIISAPKDLERGAAKNECIQWTCTDDGCRAQGPCQVHLSRMVLLKIMVDDIY